MNKSDKEKELDILEARFKALLDQQAKDPTPERRKKIDELNQEIYGLSCSVNPSYTMSPARKAAITRRKKADKKKKISKLLNAKKVPGPHVDYIWRW